MNSTQHRQPRRFGRAILNDGEPRHCNVWEFPGTPRLERPYNPVTQAVYRRQKNFAPKTQSRRGLLSFIDALRKSR